MMTSDRAAKLASEFVAAVNVFVTSGYGAVEIKKAKAAVAKMRRIYDELVDIPNGLEVISDFAHHPDPNVRGWASPYGITHFPEKFEPVLEQLANEPGRLGFDARDLLSSWRDGTFVLRLKEDG